MRYTKDLKAWVEFANKFIDHQEHLVRFGKIFDWNEVLGNPIPRNELYNWISTTLIPRLTGEKSLSAYFGRLENGVSIYDWDKEMEQHGFYTYDPESFVNVFEDDNMDYLEKLKRINDNAWLFNIAIFINEMNRQLGFTNFAQIFVAYKDKLEGELEASLKKDNSLSILYSQIWGSELVFDLQNKYIEKETTQSKDETAYGIKNNNLAGYIYLNLRTLGLPISLTKELYESISHSFIIKSTYDKSPKREVNYMEGSHYVINLKNRIPDEVNDKVKSLLEQIKNLVNIDTGIKLSTIQRYLKTKKRGDAFSLIDKPKQTIKRERIEKMFNIQNFKIFSHLHFEGFEVELNKFVKDPIAYLEC